MRIWLWLVAVIELATVAGREPCLTSLKCSGSYGSACIHLVIFISKFLSDCLELIHDSLKNAHIGVRAASICDRFVVTQCARYCVLGDLDEESK